MSLQIWIIGIFVGQLSVASPVPIATMDLCLEKVDRYNELLYQGFAKGEMPAPGDPTNTFFACVRLRAQPTNPFPVYRPPPAPATSPTSP